MSLRDILGPKPVAGPSLADLERGQLGQGTYPAQTAPESPRVDGDLAAHFPLEPDPQVVLADGSKTAGQGAKAERVWPIVTMPAPTDSWSTGQIPVRRSDSPSGVRIANAHPGRRSIVIRNNGLATVFIGAEQQSCGPTTGFPIFQPGVPGVEIILYTRAEVWASVDPAGAQDGAVALVAEYDVG